MTQPAAWIDDLRAVQPAALCAALGLRLGRAGALAPCPWCGNGTGRAPCCRIFTGKAGARVKCHNCQEGGTMVDLCARVVLGRPPRKGGEDLHTGGPVWSWWAHHGGTGEASPQGRARPLPPKTTPAPSEPAPRIPMAELVKLWGLAVPLRAALASGDGPALSELLSSKGIGAAELAELPGIDELVRVLPRHDALPRWPKWWPYNRADRTGRGEGGPGAERDVYRLALMMRDGDGQPAALQARTLLSAAELSARGLYPKDRIRWSAGGPGSCGGLALLDPGALAMVGGDPALAAECWGVVVCEGLTDTLRAAQLARAERLPVAVVGAASGGFPALAAVAARAPGARVLAAIDADGAGDLYVASLADALGERALYRVPFAPLADLCDTFAGCEPGAFGLSLSLAELVCEGLPDVDAAELAAPGVDGDAPPDDGLDVDAEAPMLASVYGAAELAAGWSSPVLELATLPGWWHPSSPGLIVGSHGWGRDVDLLCGGIRPPFFLALGAAGAGAGKTAWLHQIADGLALRTAALAERGPGPEPLTPVLFLSEMGPSSLVWRSCGRYIARPPVWLRAGEGSAALYEVGPLELRTAFDLAVRSLGAELGAAHRWIRVLTPGRGPLPPGGRALAERVAVIASRLAERLSQEHGRPVWPVVVVDPIQRYQSAELGEVEGLSEASEAWLSASEWPGCPLIVLVTSDTNKPAAKGDRGAGVPGSQGWAVGSFRGSQKLMHAASAAFCLWPVPSPSPPIEGKGRGRKPARKAGQLRDHIGRPVVGLAVAKARWAGLPRTHAVGWAWNPALVGRFEPVDLRALLRKAREAAGGEAGEDDADGDGDGAGAELPDLAGVL